MSAAPRPRLAGEPIVIPTGEAPVRCERPLRALDSVARRAETFVAAHVPERWNPLACTGAMATATLLVAVATGVLLLPFYTPTVEGAHASLRAIESARWSLGIVRSVHRYASDAAVLFALLHVGRLLLQRRVTGARTLAWVSGTAMLAAVMLVGWSGYWLAWDACGALVATTSARALDALPLFAEPLSRAFLTDEGLSGPLFFVVFFVHVLLPLAMAALLWAHVLRTPRPRLLPSSRLWVAAVAALVLLAAVAPALSGEAATMARAPSSVRLDAWFLAPLVLVSRLGAAPTLGLVTAAALLLAALPWLMRRGRPRVAEVSPSSCNACAQCVADCPYGAIDLVPRGELPGRETLVARVDASRCVGCGICSGSCAPGGIGLPWMTSLRERAAVEAHVREGARVIAWACEEVVTGSPPEAPEGCRVIVVPCAGYVHALSIERALRRGARVVVFSCGRTGCRHREGGRLLVERLHGREPALRTDRVDASLVSVIECARLDERLLARACGPEPPPGPRARSLLLRLAAGAACLLLVAPIVPVSSVALASPEPAGAELVVSFRHPGAVVERCRDRTPEELADLPPHMRTPRECVRRRMPVVVRVRVDGALHESAHEGAGAWSDGESAAIVRVPLPPDVATVEVEIDDGLASARTSRDVAAPAGRVVVLFDRERGFTWH